MNAGNDWKFRAVAGGITVLLVCAAWLCTRSAPVGFSLREHADPEGVCWQININEADQAHLEQLPGIGPVLAERIIAYREEQGGFDTIEEMTKVSGIGETTFVELEPYITVESDS